MAFDLGSLAGIGAWQALIGMAALLVLIFATVHFAHRRSYRAKIVRIKKEDEELTKYVQKFLRVHSDTRHMRANTKRLHPAHSKERPGAGKLHASGARYIGAEKAVHHPAGKGKPSLAKRLAGRFKRKKHHEQKREIERKKKAPEKRKEAHQAGKPERAAVRRELPERKPAAHPLPPLQKENESRATGHVDRLLSHMAAPPPPTLELPQHAPTKTERPNTEAKDEVQEEPKEEPHEEESHQEEAHPLDIKEGDSGKAPAPTEPAQKQKSARESRQNAEKMVQDMKYELFQVRQKLEKLRKKGRNVIVLDVEADRLRRTLNLGSRLKRSSLTRVRRKLTSLHKKADKLR
jgi:hypothetical protein